MVCSVVPRIAGLPVRVEALVPLALADRVIAQDGHPVLRQQDASPLIALVGLAVVAVAARQEDARERGLAFGEVKVRRDVVAGAALEDDFLDAVAVALERADGCGFSGVRSGRSPSERRKNAAAPSAGGRCPPAS